MHHNPHRTDQTYADELEERLINFAVRIVKLASQLPRTPAGKHVAGQILRAGTPQLRITAKLGVRKATPISYIRSVLF